MTKITTYNKGIIIDGHADTKEECETITLLCNSLAKDKNFKQVAYDDGYAAFQKIGKAEKLYLRGKENTEFYARGSGVEWRLSALAGCSGDIRTLFDWKTKSMAPYYSYWCYKMFYGCANLTTAPELLATNLSQYCYKEMFYGCVNLTIAPELPATTLEKYCYQSMFYGCTSLKVNTSSGNKIFTCPSSIPDLAVTDMFSNTGGTFKGTPTAGNTYYWTE